MDGTSNPSEQVKGCIHDHVTQAKAEGKQEQVFIPGHSSNHTTSLRNGSVFINTKTEHVSYASVKTKRIVAPGATESEV